MNRPNEERLKQILQFLADDYSIEETAKETGQDYNAVKNFLSRQRKRLGFNNNWGMVAGYLRKKEID